MADIELIQERTNGFTHQGHSVTSTDSYVKVRRSFRQNALRLLRGAPISVFWEIALADEPSDVQTICANTGYTSTATVCAALDFLVARNFIQEVGRDGSRGVKRYIAINYTWSGSDRHAPLDSAPGAGRISENEIRRAAPQTEIPSSQTEIRRPKSEIRPRSVLSSSSNQLNKKTNSKPVKEEQERDTRVQKILEHVGVFFKPHEIARVPFETARAWLYWFNAGEWMHFQDATSFTAKHLRENPTAFPPRTYALTALLEKSPHKFDHIWGDGNATAKPDPFQSEMELDF